MKRSSIEFRIIVYVSYLLDDSVHVELQQLLLLAPDHRTFLQRAALQALY